MPHQSQDLMLAYFKDSVFRDRSAVCQANVHNCRTVALPLQNANALKQVMTPFLELAAGPPSGQKQDEACPFKTDLCAGYQGGRTQLTPLLNIGLQGGDPWTP
jgi:hypothetical protein